MNAKRFKWWHCVVIYIVANGISFIPAGFNGDEAFYNNLNQPSIAPPDWLFAPMWFVLNVTSLIALYRIANLPKETPNRKSFIISEAIAWILYAVFTLFYFGLQSPKLGAIDTAMSLVFAIMSMVLAYRIDRRSGIFVTLRVAWLILATYVSIYVALNNPDPVL